MAELANLTRDLHVAILLLHHQSSKPGAAPSRGSSAIEDQADIAFRMTRYPGNRLKLWPLNGKFRIDAEPPPLWLDFTYRDGVFALGSCDPAEEDDEEREAGTTAEEVCAGRIRALAAPVAREGGWPPKQLAAAVGETQDSGTFKRALALLYAADEWEATGATTARRIRPLGPSLGPSQQAAQTQLQSGFEDEPATRANSGHPPKGTPGLTRVARDESEVEPTDESEVPWAEASPEERARRLRRLHREGAS
jgi:hypothetical protein